MAQQNGKAPSRFNWHPIFHPDYGSSFIQTKRGRVEVRWSNDQAVNKPQLHTVYHNGKRVVAKPSLMAAFRAGEKLLAH